MGFSDDLRKFTAKVERRSRDVFVGSVIDVHESVTEGSAVTGAPGQPVDSGNLKGSWQQTFPEHWIGQTATNVEYAPPIEEGIGPHGPMTLRSAVGGFHSVKLTRHNWDLLVADVTRRVVG